MKDRTILVSALIACIIHVLILFANLGMTPPMLASAAASIEVDLVAAPAMPAPAPVPEPPKPPVKPEPVIEPEPIPEPEPIIEPEPEPVVVVEVPQEIAVVEIPAEVVSTPSVDADTMEDIHGEQTRTDIDDAGQMGALTEKTVPTFDRAPAYTYNPKPRYPRAARRRGQQGTVLLLVEVLANGRVGKIEIEKTSGHELLDEAAVKAVRRWRFVPAKRGSISVNARARVPVEFNLEGER